MCALRGLHHAARTQRHFRAQLLIAAGVLLCSMWARLGTLELTALILTVAVVLGMELLNTSIEMLTDLLHPDHGPAAAAVKDVAAGAVLVAVVTATAVGLVVLLPRVIQLSHSGTRAVPALLAVLCVVLLAAGTLQPRRGPRP